MANINLLDKTIFNRIAAGEVVERPASAVKELVENSIDSGATNITIEILTGGIKRIRVTDNGCGMNAENLPKAFMPHATSKITTLNDLEKIGTLGFRGEALSSISSVAKITAVSKVKEEELGSKIEIESGEIISLTSVGASDGTTIIVDDLFYNVPARAKFLKKPKQEESEVTNVVSRLILANANITFKYVVEDKIIFLSTGNGLLEAIYAVYGKTTVDNLLPLEYERDIFKLQGFIGKPTFSKPNRTYQTLMINGRYVINQTISTAIYKAYEGFLMKGNFPFFVLNLNIPLDKVDVNVHPNKLDVKFEDSNKIFGILLHAVSNVLLTNSHVKFLDDYEDNSVTLNDIIKSNSANTNALAELKENEGKNFNDPNICEIKEVELSAQLTNNSFTNKELEEKRNSLSYFLGKDYLGGGEFAANSDAGLSYKLAQSAVKNDNIIKLEEEPVDVKLFENDNVKIIGVIFGTYIIVEQNEFVYFIDQHAAHERILYDKFKGQLENREIIIQQLLVPYILDVNYMESEFINNNLTAFNELGFEIENFGANSFKVSTVPLLFKNISINSFFNLVLKDINSSLNVTAANIIEDYLARSACRNAVKANDLLSENEIEKLLKDLNKSNQVLLCPHGRPVVIKVNNKDIEKWFKRIV